MPHYYSRKPHGKGFTYRDAEGNTVADRHLIAYFKQLAIPPAWRRVRIAYDRRKRVLATGYDAAGRKQYIYHPGFRARQEKAKFDRLLAFAERLPHMRRVTAQHLRRRKLDREKVLACMVRLIDEASFRIGNDVYAKQNKTYGLTTLRSRHLSVDGDALIFDYTGKSHQRQHKVVRDAKLAQIVREVDHLPGYEIFKYVDEHGVVTDVKSDDVNAYIKEVMGPDFSAKDFRTWKGTLLAAVALEAAVAESEKGPLKKHVTKAVEHVAERLGNTPSIARASYIDPRVIKHFLNGTTLEQFREQLEVATAEHALQPEEAAVVSLLRRRLASASQP